VRKFNKLQAGWGGEERERERIFNCSKVLDMKSKFLRFLKFLYATCNIYKTLLQTNVSSWSRQTTGCDKFWNLVDAFLFCI
jgi:hypothetical protein